MIANCQHCRKPFQPRRSTARFCNSRCRLSAHRGLPPDRGGGTARRKAQNAFLSVSGTHGTRGTANDFETLKTQQPSASKTASRLWRWYERLDGSGDLYCDIEGESSRHVARLVRDGGRYRLTKPAHLATEAWDTRADAEKAVRNKLKRAA